MTNPASHAQIVQMPAGSAVMLGTDSDLVDAIKEAAALAGLSAEGISAVRARRVDLLREIRSAPIHGEGQEIFLLWAERVAAPVRIRIACYYSPEEGTPGLVFWAARHYGIERPARLFASRAEAVSAALASLSDEGR